MTPEMPTKVLITGGHEVGGVNAFAEALAEGFHELRIPSEIIPPAQVYNRWRELRNRNVLKILSTTAVFAAPFARRAICTCHGCPCVDIYGWPRFLGVLASYKLANWFPNAQLVSVSEYTAIHMVHILNFRFDGVIRNPVKSVFLQRPQPAGSIRNYITYVGRLIPAKNVHLLLPAIKAVLDENPDMRACVIGDGDQRTKLEAAFSSDRIEFVGSQPSLAVRDFLRKTHLFVTGCQTEPLGIAVLEALSQGCVVAMPGSGGGLEIRPDLIGSQIHLLPISLGLETSVEALRRALRSPCQPVELDQYSVTSVAKAYLDIDAQNSRTHSIWVSRRQHSVGK